MLSISPIPVHLPAKHVNVAPNLIYASFLYLSSSLLTFGYVKNLLGLQIIDCDYQSTKVLLKVQVRLHFHIHAEYHHVFIFKIVKNQPTIHKPENLDNKED